MKINMIELQDGMDDISAIIQSIRENYQVEIDIDNDITLEILEDGIIADVHFFNADGRKTMFFVKINIPIGDKK